MHDPKIIIDFDAGPIEPEDWVIRSNGYIYTVYQHEGKAVGEYVELDDAEQIIRDSMEEQQFWPSVWFMDDHGGFTHHQLHDAD